MVGCRNEGIDREIEGMVLIDYLPLVGYRKQSSFKINVKVVFISFVKELSKFIRLFVDVIEQLFGRIHLAFVGGVLKKVSIKNGYGNINI